MASIKNRNLSNEYKKRTIKRVSIFLFIISIPVTIVLVLFFKAGGSEKYKQINYSKVLYKDIFINKKQETNKNKFSTTATSQIDEIYNVFQNNPPKDQPVYHEDATFRYFHDKGKSIYQFEDSDFIAGKNIFANWGSKIIFIFNDGKLIEVQYKE